MRTVGSVLDHVALVGTDRHGHGQTGTGTDRPTGTDRLTRLTRLTR